MCGVFGFVSYDGCGPSVKRLQHIAKVTMRRGPHAFGFSWIDGQGRLRMYKQFGQITDHLDLLEMVADARLMIGHCRYATQGAPENNLNNHPHAADGGWIVHNGMIRSYRKLVKSNGFNPVTDCDSEVLALLIEQSEGTLQERCVAAVQEVESGPLVMLGLWSRPARLIALRCGNPLSVGVCNGGERVYLGSLSTGLPGEVSEVADGTGLVFTARRMESIEFAREVEYAGV
jgi:glucosamine 6-phosphate synthetase-like amidotransferase/phosphosugar isomerase protein